MENISMFLIGLCVGSFVNVLIDRLPRGESVVWGRSRCDHCKKTLRWYELIPIVSFLIQQGRCRRCRKNLSCQYPLVELVTAIGFALLYSFHAQPALYPIFVSLLVIFVADFTNQIIPDSMIVLGVLGAVWAGAHLIPAIGSFVFFYLLWAVTRGRGLGFGDVKLAFLMGLFLGFPGVVIAFYVAFLTGAGYGVILMIGKKKTWKSKIAFGPFLVLGTVVAWVWQLQLATLWSMFL